MKSILTERQAIRLVRLWCVAKTGRAGITQSTRKSIESKCRTLVRILDTDYIFNESTIVRLLNGPGMPSQLHKLAKTLISVSRFATENKWVKEDPLIRVKLPAPSFEHRKYFLSHDEIRRIKTAPIIGRLAEIRDIFLLQCYTGLAYCDISRLNRSSIYVFDGFEWVNIYRKKTNKRPVVLFTEECRQIMERLNWRVNIPNNAEYNERLKEIKAICRIEKNMHSHLACKTFVQLELERGASLSTTAKRRGIDVKTLTDHYGTVNERVIAAEIRQLRKV